MNFAIPVVLRLGRNLFLLVLAFGLLVIAGCDQASVTDSNVAVPSEQEATSGAIDGLSSSSEEVPEVTRFELGLQAQGSLKPGKPVQITVKVYSALPTKQANLKLFLPAVAALQNSQGSRQPVLPRGKPIPTQGSWSQGIGQGQSLQRQTTIRIKEPGYYQVIASAIAESDEALTEDGQRIRNSTTRDLWLWIDEDGGKVTEEFDRSLFPKNARKQPGPLTLKSELPKIGIASQSSDANLQRNSSSGSTTIYVNYVNQTSGVLEPLMGARVRYTTYDGRGRQVRNSTEVIGSDGTVTIPCYSDEYYGSGTYTGTIHVQDNYRLRIYHPQTSSDRVGSFSGEFATDCGQQIPVRAAYKMSHVFMTMSETIENSRSFFQEERGKMHTHLEWDVENSYYCGPIFDPLEPWCSDGGDDTIVIMDTFGSDDPGDTDVGGLGGDFTVAHEYGHAVHEKALGGNEGGCSEPHSVPEAISLQCAYSEGFADYHAAAVGFPGYYYFESTYADESDDGSIIEGAVAAFLFDLTDPANESHDNVDYPGSYVADVIKTCEVDGDRADGIDHLIACFQREIPSYAGYFETRDDPPSSFSESASEPSGWNHTDIIKLWRENLYREDYDGSPPPPSLTVDLSGPTYLDEGEYGTWTASPSGGSGSYDYAWEVRQTPSSSWYNVCGSGSSCSWGKDLINESLNARIRVTVSSGGESSGASMSFAVNNNGGGGGCNGVATNKICK